VAQKNLTECWGCARWYLLWWKDECVEWNFSIKSNL